MVTKNLEVNQELKLYDLVNLAKNLMSVIVMQQVFGEI